MRVELDDGRIRETIYNIAEFFPIDQISRTYSITLRDGTQLTRDVSGMKWKALG